MIVQHNLLWQTTSTWTLDKCFSYSKQVEQALADLLVLPNYSLSQGFDNRYDILSNVTTFEVKFQNTNKLRLEFRQSANFNPSGIAVSKSNYWVVVCKGYTRDGDCVGKIRQYNTKVLKQTTRQTITEELYNSSNYLSLDPRQVDHIWLGDICTTDNTWDLTHWRTPGHQVCFNHLL